MLSYAPTLNAVWAIDRDNAWAVGESGIAWRYAAGQWQRVSTGGFHTLSSVWAASPTQVYAGGTRRDGSGVILRHDGNAWSEVTIPATGSIGALHGPAGGRPVAMSRFSPLLVLDGGTWRTGSPGAPSGDATAMWGTSATDFLVVGTSGYAARYDGTASLVPVASGPSNAHFVTVWGSGPSNYFAGTNNGALHRFDGSAWTPVATASGAAFRLWGPSASLLYTLSFNGEVGRLEGNAWTRLRSAENDLLFYGFHGTATRLFAVGSQGGVMMTP
jgi:hypothetical protein